MCASDQYAATTAKPRTSLLATWSSILCEVHEGDVPCIPVESEDITGGASVMDARGHGSYGNYHCGGNDYSFDALQAYCFGINIKL